MPAKKPDVPPAEYYDPCLRDTRYNNANFRKIYFEDTQPYEGQPRHTKVLHTTRAAAIAKAFIVKLQFDIGRNAALGWDRGSPLPGWNDYDQPLGEKPTE